jgi:hypothetical protein
MMGMVWKSAQALVHGLHATRARLPAAVLLQCHAIPCLLDTCSNEQSAGVHLGSFDRAKDQPEGKARRLLLGTLGAAAALLAVSCGSDSGVDPEPVVPACAPGENIQLAELQGIVASCSFGTVLKLPGNGASYLIAPQFATATGSAQAVEYAISASGAAVSMRSTAPRAEVAAPRLPPATIASEGPRPGAAQREFSHALMKRAAREAASARRHAALSGSDAAAGLTSRMGAAPDPPPLGSTRRFFVVAGDNDIRSSNANLRFAGDNILLYMDETAPPNGFTAEQLADFGRLFDQILYKLVVDVFGAPTDMDQNGRIIMLLTPRVNEITPEADCEKSGYVAGFFNGADLLSGLASNRGEMFYSAVPDLDGVFSCLHSVGGIGSTTPAVFMHELQHLISFSQRVVARNGTQEAGWLDEGLSMLAEELGSIYFEQRYPAPTGRTRAAQLFPDSSALFMAEVALNSYEYLLNPETQTLTRHEAHDPGVAWRGGAWLLARWLADHYGTSVFRKLIESKQTGVANLEAATGDQFKPMFGRFGLSLYTDSFPGLPKTAVPVGNRFTSRTLRRIYQAYSVVVDLPRLFPIEPLQLTQAGTKSSMVPGTTTFYRLDTAASAATTTVTFTTRTGTYFEPELEPQISVFRLPKGQ